MTKFLAVLVAVLGVACSAAPPETYAIERTVRPWTIGVEDDFTVAQAEVIRDAVHAWCLADRGFCPVEVGWDERPAVRIYLAQDYAKFARPDRSFGWTNAERTEVQINPDAAEDLHIFWRVIAHEFGHLSGLEHGEGGLELMKRAPDPWGPLAIE